MSSGEARNIASFISWLFIKDFIKRAISSQCCSELIFALYLKINEVILESRIQNERAGSLANIT